MKRRKKRIYKRITKKDIIELRNKMADIIFYASVEPEKKPGFLGGALPNMGNIKNELVFNGLASRYKTVKQRA